MELSTLKRNYIKEILILLGATFLLIAVDQATKCYVVRNITASDPVIIIENFFEFTYVLNPGAAFGFLADNNSSFKQIFFILVTCFATIFILYMYFTLKDDERIVKVALCLILGGALGNFIDRLRIKSVIDFIYVHYYEHYWPAFNIADALITIGVVLIGIDIFIKYKKEKGAA